MSYTLKLNASDGNLEGNHEATDKTQQCCDAPVCVSLSYVCSFLSVNKIFEKYLKALFWVEAFHLTQ